MISEFINGIDWVGEFKDKNVQESYTGFLRHYNKACELYIQNRHFRGNKTKGKMAYPGNEK